MASRVRAPRLISLSSRARLLSSLATSSAPVKDAGASGPGNSGSGQRSLKSSWQKLQASAKEHAGLVSILGGAAGGLVALVYLAAGLQHQQELRVERKIGRGRHPEDGARQPAAAAAGAARGRERAGGGPTCAREIGTSLRQGRRSLHASGIVDSAGCSLVQLERDFQQRLLDLGYHGDYTRFREALRPSRQDAIHADAAAAST